MTKSRLALVLHLIGPVGSASFFNQSQSVVKQNQTNPGLLSTTLTAQSKSATLKLIFRVLRDFQNGSDNRKGRSK